MLPAHLGVDQFECRGVRHEVDVPVDRIQHLWSAQEQSQGLVGHEPVDPVGGEHLLGLRLLRDHGGEQPLELRYDRAGAELTGPPDKRAMLLERRSVGGLRALFQQEDVPLRRVGLLRQPSPGGELLLTVQHLTSTASSRASSRSRAIR